MIDESGVCALLNAVDRLAVEVDEFAEFLLGELPLGAGSPDVVSDLASAGWNPGGQRIGWHASTLVGPVISVCTIVGTFPGTVSGRTATHSVRKHPFE